jgi:hypothetical protein
VFKYLLTSLLFVSSVGFGQDDKAETTRDVDYLDLGHSLRLQKLRAGNHDESGFNNYYFVVTFYGIVSNEEERRKKIEERRKLEFDGGKFAEVGLKSLSHWKGEDKTAEGYSFEIPGDLIRNFISQTMAKFDVAETETAIRTEIVMYEKNKKYVFFGEDTKIAHTEYYPIPATKFDAKLRTNQDLNLKDKKGTEVVIRVDYGAVKK